MPVGFSLLPDFLSPEEESEVTTAARDSLDQEKCDASDQAAVTTRTRVCRFGHSYGRDTRTGELSECVPMIWQRPIPEWIVMLAASVRAVLGVEDAFDSVALNEYPPGAGIHPHVDAVVLYEELVAVASVNESATFRIFRPGEQRSCSIVIPRRGLVTMRGEARYDYHHAVDADPRYARVRYSVVLRTRRK